MNYLLFIIYLLLFCWLVTKVKFINNAGIEKRVIIFLFLIRIAAGLINGYINLYHYPGTDASAFHQEGLIEYHLLFNNPGEYFTNIFNYQHQTPGLLDITDSYWNNLRNNLIIKLISIFDIFSRGNFFINIIFYNFLIFFGSIAFYKIFIRLFPDKKMLLLLALFILPSLLYFTAGIHKDGLIFLALGIICYNLFCLIKDKFSIQKFFWLITGITIIFLLRNFVLITLLPAMAAWIIAENFSRSAFKIYLITYAFFIILFFSLGSVHSSLNLPKYVSERQLAFIQIAKGSVSAININPLYQDFRSFLNNSPQALNHTLMRPYLTEKFNFLYLPASIEILIYQLLFIVFLFFRIKTREPDAFIYFCIFFGISMFLMIGYTIPIIGAIVRYRSIYLPFVILPMILYTNWQKILHLIK